MPTISRSGKRSAQDVERDAVVGIVEDRDQHDAVGDIEIAVAGGQAAAFKDNGAGHGEFDDRERLAVLVGGGAQAADVFPQGFVVWSSGSDSTAVTTVSGATKRVMSSTWPWVSSPAMPRAQPDHLLMPR